MSRRLVGRKILVTGAASGIGREIASLFSTEGAPLALLDRDEAGVQAFAASLSAANFTCDVTQRAQVDRVVATAAETLNGLDGLVNAAGVLDIAPFGELSPDSWDRMIAVNLTGPFNVVKAALPYLQQAERATIVNIASISALLPMAGTAGEAPSEAGLTLFTKGVGRPSGTPPPGTNNQPAPATR